MLLDLVQQSSQSVLFPLTKVEGRKEQKWMVRSFASGKGSWHSNIHFGSWIERIAFSTHPWAKGVARLWQRSQTNTQSAVFWPEQSAPLKSRGQPFLSSLRVTVGVRSSSCWAWPCLQADGWRSCKPVVRQNTAERVEGGPFVSPAWEVEKLMCIW